MIHTYIHAYIHSHMYTCSCLCVDGWMVDIVHIIIIKKIRGREFESKREVGRRREEGPVRLWPI